MIAHQEHFGRQFYQDKKTGYWISCDYPRIRAHRWVWISIHGNIPKGYHIHHRDENKSNNAIENLELISASRHCSIHYSEEKRQSSKLLMEKIRPLTKDWHRSAEGRAWHKLHALKCNFGKNISISKKCECCGIEYIAKKASRIKFCSNNCKSKARRDSKVDNIIRICVNCNKEFSVDKYRKTKNCSKLCAQRFKTKGN